MAEKESPGTTAEEYHTAETAKYYTPHFKAGGLTGIISPGAAEFTVGDEENGLESVKYAIGGFPVSMEQMLKLKQMHEKNVGSHCHFERNPCASRHSTINHRSNPYRRKLKTMDTCC